MRSISFFLLVLILPITVFPVSDSIFMEPQSAPAAGPWFEGWYVRVTDPARGQSFATITTTYAPNGQSLQSPAPLPGYVAFLHDFGGERTHSAEYFPERTWLSNGQAPESKILLDAGNHWRAEGIGHLNSSQIELSLPNGDRIEMDFGPRLPWNENGPHWGPGGAVQFLSFLPLQWHVESRGSPVRYKVYLAGSKQIIEGSGYAHIEKNWGKVFPKGWLWVQGTDAKNESQLAFAGGPIQMAGLPFKSFLIGYKSAVVDVEIRPDQLWEANFKETADACNGKIRLRAKNARHEILVDVSADPASFAPVSIPTSVGYQKNGGIESFRSRIEITVWESGKFIEQKVFENAAMEFGGIYQDCPAKK